MTEGLWPEEVGYMSNGAHQAKIIRALAALLLKTLRLKFENEHNDHEDMSNFEYIDDQVAYDSEDNDHEVSDSDDDEATNGSSLDDDEAADEAPHSSKLDEDEAAVHSDSGSVLSDGGNSQYSFVLRGPCDHGTDFYPKTVTLLRLAADALQEAGIRLEVIRMRYLQKKTGVQEKLLIAPGLTSRSCCHMYCEYAENFSWDSESESEDGENNYIILSVENVWVQSR